LRKASAYFVQEIDFASRIFHSVVDTAQLCRSWQVHAPLPKLYHTLYHCFTLIVPLRFFVSSSFIFNHLFILFLHWTKLATRHF